MKEKKAYLQEDLTLPRLAKITGLKTHQLSEILNRELNSNFNAYVNAYRIEDAKKLLKKSRIIIPYDKNDAKIYITDNYIFNPDLECRMFPVTRIKGD